MGRRVTAGVITCPGRLGDDTFRALEISIDGLRTPYHMVLALPACSARALAREVDPTDLYGVLMSAINKADVRIPEKQRQARGRDKIEREALSEETAEV